MQILSEGQGEYLKPDPDGYREWVRDHKSRAMVSKLMTEKEAVQKFVHDGVLFPYGPVVQGAIREGRVKAYEYSNVVMTNRIMAGAMGLPFIAVRSFGGTDGFKYSGAKLIEDPYTGQPTVIVPALNPDVALIHVHQADVYGNARH